MSKPIISAPERTVASVFPGHGEMAELCRATDWAATPLGPVSRWPLSLRTIVAAMLASRHPMFLFWGPRLVQFYNDAYRPSLGLGDRHPAALGAEGESFWVDIWDVIGPQIDQVMSGGEATWHEDQFIPIFRNGTLEQVYWTYSYSPVRDDEGAIGGTLVVCQETTRRVLVEKEIREADRERIRLLDAERAARADAEAANRAKSDFLAVMSHELRTPLNAIGGYAQLLEMGLHGPVTPDQTAALGRIQACQRHLLGLIAEVLNYSQIEKGTVDYRQEQVPVADIVSACEVVAAPLLRAKQLSFSLVGSDADLYALGDREKIHQIVINLLSNAIKFTDPGGKVAVECRNSGDTVSIVVSDTGSGIAPENFDRIFEPFVQAIAKSAHASEGVGLGLAISRNLARGMGGDLTLQSTAGAGSSFTLTLPRSNAPIL